MRYFQLLALSAIVAMSIGCNAGVAEIKPDDTIQEGTVGEEDPLLKVEMTDEEKKNLEGLAEPEPEAGK